MLTLERLLDDAGLDPREVAVFRHRPPETQLRALLPSFAAERRELFSAYQAIQTGGGASLLKGCRYLVAFIGQDTGFATFAGIWSVGAYRRLAADQVLAVPGMAELVGLGLAVSASDEEETYFDLEGHDAYAEWIGRLIVKWPSRGINWRLRAHNHSFPMHAVTEESRFVAPLPPWSELALSWSQLSLLPRSWKDRLSQWRGVYFIFDEARERGYVGSAAGADNILGRWAQYAASGHGGNVSLKDSDPQNLRFSILELTAPMLDRDDVLKLEESWKVRLHTREHGLNAN